jgi:hypothetical protein
MKSATRSPRASRVLVLAGIFATGLAAMAVAHAQVPNEQVPNEEVPPSSATPVPPEAAPIEDEKLDQYADAFLDIEQIKVKAAAELEKAEDAATAVAIKEKTEGAIIEAIERSGLKLNEFNQITEVAALNEDVRRRIKDRVETRRTI